MFEKVDPKQSLPEMEKKILKFWEENKIFEKSVEKNSADKSFIFFEGPPTANGQPGLHHVLARSFKDIIPRYKTMKGFRVERKAGWDTHGLPVEIQVEKELGIHTKPEIENIVPGNVRESVIEFNKKCKESVWKYKDLWEKLTERMAYWVDIKHPYITYENKYIESVWWTFAQIFKTKGKNGESLVYQGSKVIPYCYRCGTGLSSHEVAQGYQKVKDNSVYVKFKAKSNPEKGVDDNTYFLVWTTTPWTLPGNVALAVGPINYCKVKAKNSTDNEIYILAKERVSYVFGEGNYEILKEFDPSALMELEYEPLYDIALNPKARKYYNPLNKNKEKVYFLITGDFILTSEGTGIVHIAPSFGEDDLKTVEKYDSVSIPTDLATVDEEGKIIKGFNLPGEGIPVKKKNDKNQYEADRLIIEDLKNREGGGLVFREEIVEHDYPHCWRCDMPLIYYAKPSWFIRMSELADDLKKNNEAINWIPGHIKHGRFGEWLENVKDWAISRERYWGTPLPIWLCEKCGEQKAIESIEELEKLSGQRIEDLHKPYIDEINFPCRCGKGKMLRTPEVMDVWFDSGVMPLAQFNYPNGATDDEKEKIESGKYFPADYISEAIDQTRGWFYTLHAIATVLHLSKKIPAGNAYKNVICLGHILDGKGKKMSKSKGNVIEPMAVMDEYGADALRWMLFSINQPGLPKRFDIKGMRDVANRVFRMLWNTYYFFTMYANIDKFQPTAGHQLSTANLLDKWIISELNSLIKNVDQKLGKYDVYGSTNLIENFIDNLSNWYIRRSRKRFWKSENDADKNQAYEALHHVLAELSKLMAPFTPFVAEEMYKNLTGDESVHLVDFPAADEKLIDEELNEKMRLTRRFVKLGLAARAKAGIKVRQPLSELKMNEDVGDELKELIKDEVNVKKVSFAGGITEEAGIIREEEVNWEAGLNTRITDELRLEGEARELVRRIQELRKKAGFQVDNRISLCYQGGKEIFEKFGDLIAKETLAEDICDHEDPDADISELVALERTPVKVWLRKIEGSGKK